MTESEIAVYLGSLFGSYVIGWGAGVLIYTFKKLSEYI
tara:strand:+ start:263 stop:376 length:114 start_codon:yes stop_codon:yes gene_type:complete